MPGKCFINVNYYNYYSYLFCASHKSLVIFQHADYKLSKIFCWLSSPHPIPFSLSQEIASSMTFFLYDYAFLSLLQLDLDVSKTQKGNLC